MLGFVKSLKEKLSKTQKNILGKISDTFSSYDEITDDLYDDLEEVLIQADMGVDLSADVIDKLREEVKSRKIKKLEDVKEFLGYIMESVLIEEYDSGHNTVQVGKQRPYVILFIGVNGVGKTTTIGKLATRFVKEGKSVMLIAGDTFRAAAIEQLTIWAERSGAFIVKSVQDGDPSAIVFDGLTSAVSKKVDVIMIDTAGRQHNKVNLMNELEKIGRTIKKVVPDAPHETLLVVDATTGQNAVSQARMFNKAVKLDGLVLTKLDGTAKGGVVFGIKHSLDIPVKLIGVGEAQDDLRDFNAEEYVNAVLDR
ncbi:MAG: signal recognition particle-docking protein FtsY [Candidatus Cloacimonadota bacterium]|nr:MAG: signal recognition particle-docking protein FtsY [Candidatus Cloacimonadota bacterium]